MASSPVQLTLLGAPHLFVAGFTEIRVLHQDESLNRDKGLQQRGSCRTPGFRTITSPGSKYGEANLSFFIKITIALSGFCQPRMRGYSRVDPPVTICPAEEMCNRRCLRKRTVKSPVNDERRIFIWSVVWADDEAPQKIGTVFIRSDKYRTW